MKNKKIIEALNLLISVNNNRIEGYATASKQSKDADTKVILFQLLQTCKTCKTELISEVLQLGGIPSERILITDRFFRILRRIRNALETNIKQSVLNSCLYAEYVAIDAYNEILKNKLGHITSDLEILLSAQNKKIKGNHSDLKNFQLKY